MGGSGGVAAVQYEGDYRLLYLAFPVESIETTSAECQPGGESMKFHVTTVDEKDLESGVSRQLWVPSPRGLNAPMSIFYDRQNDRIILSSLAR